MREATNGSILIISHQERILEIADQIVVLADGQVSKIGTREEIMPELLNSADVARGCNKLDGGNQ